MTWLVVLVQVSFEARVMPGEALETRPTVRLVVRVAGLPALSFTSSVTGVHTPEASVSDDCGKCSAAGVPGLMVAVWLTLTVPMDALSVADPARPPLK